MYSRLSPPPRRPHGRLLLLNWLFNVTINDISVIYVTTHRCAGGLKEKMDLRSGSQRHRHFVGFFNVPVQAPTRDQPFYTVRLGYCFTPYQRLRLYNGAPLVAFCDTVGIRRTYSRLKPPASPRGTFLYGDSDTPPQQVAFYDTLGIRRTHSRLNPPPPRPRGPSRGLKLSPR